MEELPSLFYAHWLEVASDKDRISLDPDWQKYCQMDGAGMLVCHTLRVGGKLYGYFFSVVVPHLHYRKSLTAIQDIYYVARECRHGWLPYRFFKWTDKELKGRGVQRRYVMRKYARDPRIGNLWLRLGYRTNEVWYSKILED
jgi:hypothetical protein